MATKLTAHKHASKRADKIPHTGITDRLERKWIGCQREWEDSRKTADNAVLEWENKQIEKWNPS